MNDNRPDKKTSGQDGIMSAAAIIVMGIFAVCVIFVLAKGLFASNSPTVPEGLDTATIAPKTEPSDDTSSLAEVLPAENVLPTDESIAGDESGADTEQSFDTDSSDQTTESAAEETPAQTATVTQYVQLRSAPGKDAPQIVCLSPNLVVTIISEDAEGYCLVSFYNFGTDYTEGYVHKDYLTMNQN